MLGQLFRWLILVAALTAVLVAFFVAWWLAIVIALIALILSLLRRFFGNKPGERRGDDPAIIEGEFTEVRRDGERLKDDESSPR